MTTTAQEETTTKRIKLGEDGIMNTSPHDMHAFDEDGNVVVFEKGPVMVRCTQAEGPEIGKIKGVRVVAAQPYSLNKDDLQHYKKEGVKTLLCSTILANFHEEIKQELGRDVRILVPNSGASAKRGEGNTIIVKEFMEYGV